MLSPGITENSKLLNIKQDNQRYLNPHRIQREYDKTYVEKELEDDMHLVKEQCYSHDFADASTVSAYKSDSPLARFGTRNTDVKIDLKETDKKSFFAKCLKFTKELTADGGKNYVISAPFLDEIFKTKLMPEQYGFKVSFKLDRQDEMEKYIEVYDKQASLDRDYRFRILRNKKIRGTYQTSELTLAGENKFNQMFANSSCVVVSQFPVFVVKHQNIESRATELLNFDLPATTYMPDQTLFSMVLKDDFNHASVRNNYLYNVLPYFTKKIKFNDIGAAHPTYLEGTNFIDFEDPIDQEGLWNTYKRYAFGTQNVNLSNSKTNYGLLNGASKEFYSNLYVEKGDFLKFRTRSQSVPIPIDLETSHGQYEPDQRPAKAVNTPISMNFLFKQPLTGPAVIMAVCQYKGSYVMKKTQNGVYVINYESIDIPSNLM